MQGSIATNTTTSEEAIHAHESAVHAEHPDLRVFGLIVFLISEGMLFFGLFAAYLTFRSVATSWPPEGTPELELLLPGINSIILVSSSFVIHQADSAIKANKIKAAQLNTLIPVGTATSKVATMKNTRSQSGVPLVNIWCAHTNKPKAQIIILE